MPGILDSLVGYSHQYDGAVALSDNQQRVTRAGLSARVAALAGELRLLPRSLGLLGDNCVDIAVAQLAGWCAGKIMVPLPAFFSPSQLKFLLADAQVSHVVVTAKYQAAAQALGLATTVITNRPADLQPSIVSGGGQIIYTSGSTGTPKGVKLGLGQIDQSAAALVKATAAQKSDVYLSLLPLPLLLETICAICLPLLVNGRTIFDSTATQSIATGSPSQLAGAFDHHRPTTAMLVPQLLSQWVDELETAGRRAPDSLRFVAVGGAPVSPALSERAWNLGIPVHEGYGLSECCAVVALNRPSDRCPGTVGRPIAGIDVRIIDGEIVVSGPTIMDGYLNREPATNTWRTGDMGRWDDAGNLIVEGRRDSMLVTSFGRNVSPEWIEAMLASEQRVAAVAVTGHGQPALCAIIVPSPQGADWLYRAPKDEIITWIERACRDAPGYAVPKDYVVVPREHAASTGLFTANGRINRAVANELAIKRQAALA
jgi:long-subunit acyl-CoA synthetase (AMP-forming)